jgi:hypothetical protein
VQTLFLFHSGKQILNKSIFFIESHISGAAFFKLAIVRPLESQHVPQKGKLNCRRSASRYGLAENSWVCAEEQRRSTLDGK